MVKSSNNHGQTPTKFEHYYHVIFIATETFIYYNYFNMLWCLMYCVIRLWNIIVKESTLWHKKIWTQITASEIGLYEESLMTQLQNKKLFNVHLIKGDKKLWLNL